MEEIGDEAPCALEGVRLMINSLRLGGLEIITAAGDGSYCLTVHTNESRCAFCDGHTFDIFELTQLILRDDAGHLTCLNVPIDAALLVLLQVFRDYRLLLNLRFCRLLLLRLRLRLGGLDTCTAVGAEFSTFFQFMMTIRTFHNYVVFM